MIDKNFDYPKISVWITSTGRYELVKNDIESFVEYNTYPNWQFIIFESVPTEESLKYYNTPLIQSDKTIEYLKTVPNVHKLMVEPWPPWGQVLQKLLDATDTEFFINMDDDWTTIYDPHEWFIEVIELLRSRKDLFAMTGNLQRSEFNESWPGWESKVNDGKFNYGYGKLVSTSGMLGITKMARRVGGYPDHHIGKAHFLCPESPEGIFGDRILLDINAWGGRLFNWYGWFCSKNIYRCAGVCPHQTKHKAIQEEMIRQDKVGRRSI